MSKSLTPVPSLFIGGVTGSGKSELATALARACGGIVINADAFQLYRELPVLTAQPDRVQQATVSHALYGVCSVQENLSAARYWELACDLDVGGQARIFTGGTGLYLRMLMRGGLAPMPEVDPALRSELSSLPLEELVVRLLAADPEAAGSIDLKNPRRVQRALEISLGSGRPISEQRKNWEAAADGPVQGVWLDLPRETLLPRLERRARAMLSSGAVEEVAACREYAGETARGAIGFTPICDLLDGRRTLADCTEKLIIGTRQYAKRQATWFRKEPALQRWEAVPETREQLVKFLLSLLDR